MAETRPGSTQRRSVSFGPPDTFTLEPISGDSPDIDIGTFQSNGHLTPTTSSSGGVALSRSSSTTGSGGGPSTPQHNSATSTSPPSSVLKSAMKAGKDHRRLPPAVQYQHADPLLRRLRMVDAHGQPVDLRKMFRDTKVVGFYFASQWAGQPLKEYHQAISDFCRAHPHEFKAIYVSVDVDEQWYKAGVQDKPWMSMVWNDGSSMPTERSDRTAAPVSPNGDLDELPRLYNNEDFLLANEDDIDESLSHTDKSGEAYLRPFSRVHLAAKLNIIAAPTLCIYHLESGKMLEWNVRMGRLASHRVDETWQKWQQGEKASRFSAQDIFAIAPYTFLLAAVAAIYYLFVFFAGQEYNVLRNTLFQLFGEDQGAANMLHAAKGEL